MATDLATKDWEKMTPEERVQHCIFRCYVTHPVIGQLAGFYRHVMAFDQEVKLDEPLVIKDADGKEVLRVDKINLTDVPTACTDGESIWYNPRFVGKCTKQALCFLILHEAMHNVLAHHVRRDGREPQKWNVGIDGAINQILLGEFFGATSRGATLADKFKGTALDGGVDREQLVKKYGCDEAKVTDASGEVIYSNIKQTPPPPKGSNALGDLIGHALSEALQGARCKKRGKSAQEETNDQVSKMLQVIQNTRDVGKIPGALLRQVEELVEPQVDYAAVLRQFLSKDVVGDYGFARPSRRQEAMPDWAILAGAGRVPGSGTFVVAFDTSGSIYGSKALIDEMMAEVYGIQRDTDSELVLIYCDMSIPIDPETGDPAVHFFNSGETVRDVVDHRIKPVGGGGTSFKPPFEYLEEQGIVPDAFIYFTDLYGDFPAHAPNYPVIWITFEDGKAPFGKTINVKRSAYSE